MRRAHFGIGETLISWAGLPLFVYLLLRSRLHYTWRKQVEWKGRVYRPASTQHTAELEDQATLAKSK